MKFLSSCSIIKYTDYVKGKVNVMKLTYLGTAAAEGFPAVFCNCKYCIEARKLGGKNIRTRSQALINDDLLIDLPADTYMHFLQNGIEGDKIKYLLITHSHGDHLYAGELHMRQSPYSHDERSEKLEIYASRGAYDKMTKTGFPKSVSLSAIGAYESVSLGKYTVTALPARHMAGDFANIYIIKGDKTLLYAHDTGFFYDEVFDFIEKQGIVFDMISLDCTNVDIPIPDSGTHMGFPNIERLIARLTDIGAINSDTKKIVNHFSHNGGPLHTFLEARASEYGCSVSYDGMSVEI